MGEIERRLSVQEKIEELERNKITLHPPVYDSTLSLSAGKKSPLDVDISASETPRNTIRFIKMNDAESVTQQNDQSANNTNKTVKMENDATIEINFTQVDSENKMIEDANAKNAQKDGTHEEGRGSDENKKDTEKKIDNNLETLNETKLELKDSTVDEPMKEKHEEIKPDNKLKCVEDSNKSKKDEGLSKNSEPLVPLTDEAIDKIVEKYAGYHKDKKVLQQYLDFFFDIDRPHYGYFTYEMLMSKLYREGYRLSERAIASMFCDLDADKDFLVSLDEYLTEMSKSPRKEVLKEEELKELFQRVDADQDGVLSRNDIEACVKQSSIRVPTICILEEIMSYDKSGNREKLDFDEFLTCYREGRRLNSLHGNDWFDGLLPLTITADRGGYIDYKRINFSGDNA